MCCNHKSFKNKYTFPWLCLPPKQTLLILRHVVLSHELRTPAWESMTIQGRQLNYTTFQAGERTCLNFMTFKVCDELHEPCNPVMNNKDLQY